MIKISNYNQINYSLIYSKWKRIQYDLITDQQILNNKIKENPTLQFMIDFDYENNIAYEYIPPTTLSTNYFYDGAPGHILTTKDPLLAHKFKHIGNAIHILKQKFNSTFHEGPCILDVKIAKNIYNIEEYFLDYIYIPNENTKIQNIHRFQLYNPFSAKETQIKD